MGHTNETVNVGLPQFISTDKPTWLGDINGAFQKIDTEFGNVNATATGAEATANAAAAAATNAVSTANAASTAAGNAETDAASANALATEAIGTANNAQSTAVLAKNTADAALAKAEHGFIELYKNADITAAFAPQSIRIANFDFENNDAIILSVELSTNETYGAMMLEFDKDIIATSSYNGYILNATMNTSTSAMLFYQRTITIERSNNDLVLTFGDGHMLTQQAIGTPATDSVSNGILIPVRVLALRHNE